MLNLSKVITVFFIFLNDEYIKSKFRKLELVACERVLEMLNINANTIKTLQHV